MSEQKFIVAFTKWHDPWGLDEDEQSKDDGYEDELPSFEDSMEFDGEEEPKRRRAGPMKAIMTPMGPIPLNEHSSPSKNWNLWVGHSNFRFTDKLVKIIANVDGVETLDVFSPYRIRVGIGKLFQSGQVIGRITATVNQELNKSVS